MGNAGLAVVLTIFFPGLGQVYNEEYLKAIIIAILFLVAVAMIVLGIGIILAPIVWIYAAWDAHSVAQNGSGPI